MEIPSKNVNLCLVGGVSTGKSTVLNSFFLQQFAPSSKQRTTMVPIVYVESESDPDTDLTAAIYSAVEEKNRDLLDKSSKGVPPQTADYNEMVFPVGKLDISLRCDCRFNIYDIPGLNDARTKNLYYDYLRATFAKFNVVILLVDVQSGINTSDEMDILKFVVGETTRHKATRKIRTIVVANKCDDMQLDDAATVVTNKHDDMHWDDATKRLTLEGELQTMYAQVVSTVTETFLAAGIEEHLIGVVPLCALDAYLYRMIRKHGADFKLSPEQILKIGVNEQGKKFSKMSRAKQEAAVAEIVRNESFLRDMIDLSGFAGFETMLQKHLRGSYKTDQIANILATLAPFNVDAEIAPYINKPPGLFSHLPKDFPWTAVRAHIAAYKRLAEVDKAMHVQKCGELYDKLSKYIYKVGGDGARHPIEAYDQFRAFVEHHFEIKDLPRGWYPRRGEYPPLICVEVEKQLMAVPPFGLEQLKYFSVMKEIGLLTRKNAIAYVQDRFLSVADFKLVYNPSVPPFNQNPYSMISWNQEQIDQLYDALVEIEAVLGASEVMLQVARHFWATYIIHVQKDTAEQYKRRVLHLSKCDDYQTVAILFQDGFPCRDARQLSTFVHLKELRSDGHFKLDFYYFDLMERYVEKECRVQKASVSDSEDEYAVSE